MAGSLDSAWAKWERAGVHYEALVDATTGGFIPIAGFREYRASVEAEPDGLEYRFYLDLPPPNPAIALLAGDCFFNLRAALDHLVYALYERHHRGRVPESVQESAQFPIYTTLPRIRSGAKKGTPIPPDKWAGIRGLAARQRRAIAFLQPYNTRDDELTYTRESLGILATLNNIDKHRHLHVVRDYHFVMGVPGGWDEYGFRSEPFFGPIEGKTEVCRWTFTSGPPPDVAKQVEFERDISTGIALNEGGHTTVLVPRAEAILNAVERVLNRFAPLFR